MENDMKIKRRNLTSYRNSKYIFKKKSRVGSEEQESKVNYTAQNIHNARVPLIYTTKYIAPRNIFDRLKNFAYSKSFYKERKRPRNALKEEAHISNRNTALTMDSNWKDINQLKTMLEVTVQENQKLKLLNKEIMFDKSHSRQMASTVHSFYQNVILTENKQNLNELKDTIEELREQIAELNINNQRLKEENKKLKASLTKYKRLVNKLSGDNLLAHKDSMQATTECQLNDTLDSLHNLLKQISNTQSISELIKVLYRDIDKLVEGNRVGIFIVEQRLRMLYVKEQGRVESVTAGTYSIDFALPPSLSLMKPVFIPCKVIKKSANALSVPILGINSELYLLLQIEGERKTEEMWVTQ
jgi:regulator of replication initiation timing